jgi:signal transduction histidine kinase
MSRPWLRRLRTRLFASHVVVVVAGAVTMVIVAAAVTQTVYRRRLGGLGVGRGQGRGVSEAELTSALDQSLVVAMLVGTLAALAVAAIVAWFVGGRLLRPVDDLRAATRRMAAGDFAVEVPIPTDTELAALADDVNELGDHLATTERRRTQLLGEVTHELRTPITVIRGQMEGLLDRVIAPSDEVYATVVDEAARLQRLVDDLTMLSQVDEGALRIVSEPVDLAAVADAAAERLRPQFDDVGVVLTIDGSNPVMVSGDPDRLTQVITNLLGNALGHTPRGGTVAIRSGRDGEIAWVEVSDSGTGIQSAELERIFDRFYRVADVDPVPGRTPRAGRGLGLTIARSLARAHGGDVVASSHGPGTGATFRLTVPAA